MERGIRQGDPTSGYLFNLVMQPLTNHILHSTNIHGIPVAMGTEVRLSQYADDLIVFSRAQLNPIKEVFNTLEQFSQVSGLRINKEKTKCLPIGKSIDISSLMDAGLNIVNELRVLGIVYKESNKNIVTRNIQEILPKIRQEIVQWKRRSLTLIGKITVVKTLLMSKLVHIFSALPNPPKDIITEINNILFKFVWNDRPDKIKRSRLVQNYDRGGLKMVDLTSFIKSLKITWLKRLYWAKSNTLWANVAREELYPIENLVCFGANKLRKIAKSKNNLFWRDVIDAWADFCVCLHNLSSEKDTEQILTEKIWFSDYTKFTMATVKQWDKKGLRFIADLYCKETGQLHDKSTLCGMFNINMTFLCYSSLVRSISVHSQINNSVSKPTYPILPYKIALLAQKANTSRIAYLKFIVKLDKTVTNSPSQTPMERKWCRDIGCVHEGTMRDVRGSTKNTYLQAFHYRVISRIISTNTFLHRIGRSLSPLCTFCKVCNETLYHILWECSAVQDYIREITTYFQEKANIVFHFTAESWIFPRLSEESKVNIIIITIAKVVIFKAKYRENQPSLRHFISLLKIEAQKEEECAMRNKERKKAQERFFLKWAEVLKILDS